MEAAARRAEHRRVRRVHLSHLVPKPPKLGIVDISPAARAPLSTSWSNSVRPRRTAPVGSATLSWCAEAARMRRFAASCGDITSARRIKMEDAWILVLGHYRDPRLRHALTKWRLQTPPFGPIVRIVQLAYKRAMRGPFQEIARRARLARYADLLRGSRKVVLQQRLHEWRKITASAKRQLAAARLGRAEWWYRRATKLNCFTEWRAFCAARQSARRAMLRAVQIGRSRTVHSATRATAKAAHAVLAVAFFHWHEFCPHFVLSIVSLRQGRLDGAVRLASHVAQTARRAAHAADLTAAGTVEIARENRVWRRWNTDEAWRIFQVRVKDARRFRLSAEIAVASIARAVLRRAWCTLAAHSAGHAQLSPRFAASRRRQWKKGVAAYVSAAANRLISPPPPTNAAAIEAEASLSPPAGPPALARLVAAGATLAVTAPPDWVELGDALAELLESDPNVLANVAN